MEDVFAKLTLKDDEEEHSTKPEDSGGASSAGAEGERKSTSDIKVLSWNVMGDEKDDLHQTARMAGVVEIINQKQPEVIFLQSLSQNTCEYFIKAHSRKYVHVQHIDDAERDKHRLLLLRKSSVTRRSSEILDMPECKGKHDAVKVTADVRGIPMTLIAVHIRSKKEFLQVRMRQHEQMFRLMKQGKAGETVICGGTTNSRDYEHARSGQKLPPPGIYDVWQAAGSPLTEENTWDMSTNTNRKPTPGRNLHAFRFERLFIRHPSEGPKVKVTDFKLVGREELSCGKYPSDHFGVMVTLKQVD